jgi:hypothetical protein
MRVNNGLQWKASKPTSAEPARYDTNTSCTAIAQRLGMSSLASAGRCSGERDWQKGTILNLSRTRRAFYNFMTVPSAITRRSLNSNPQIVQKLRCWSDTGHEQIIPRTGACDVEQVPFGVVDFSVLTTRS